MLPRWICLSFMACASWANDINTTQAGFVTDIAGDWMVEGTEASLLRGNGIAQGAVILAKAGQSGCSIRIFLKNGPPIQESCRGQEIRITVPIDPRPPAFGKRFLDVVQKMFLGEKPTHSNGVAKMRTPFLSPSLSCEAAGAMGSADPGRVDPGRAYGLGIRLAPGIRREPRSTRTTRSSACLVYDCRHTRIPRCSSRQLRQTVHGPAFSRVRLYPPPLSLQLPVWPT